jgi:uncharacterized protein YlaI
MTERIERKFNKPVYKVGRNAVFWVKEFQKISWNCHKCGAEQKKGSLAFELTVKYSEKIHESPTAIFDEKGMISNLQAGKESWLEKPIKHYLCMNCASTMLTETNEKVMLLKRLGIDAFKLFEEL